MNSSEETRKALEDELSSIQDDLLRSFVNDEEDSEEEEVPRSTSRPGSIQPMGVRVDRGRGFLSLQTATTTLSEMDALLSGLKRWQQQHDKEVADMMSRNVAAMETIPTISDPALDWVSETAEVEVQDEPEANGNGHMTTAPAVASAHNPLRVSTSFRFARDLTTDDMALLSGLSHVSFTPKGSANARKDKGATPPGPDPVASTRALLASLEAELEALEAGSAPGHTPGGLGTRGLKGAASVETWANELESVLARMDALQTGYQVDTSQLKPRTSMRSSINGF